jgi:hypothetical protein
MKFKLLCLTAIFGLLTAACSKIEDANAPVVERSPQLKMQTLKGFNFTLPVVPAYVETSAPIEKKVISVAPGSNQLQSILNNAAPNATIRLLAGTHTENNAVVINRKVRLTGEPGAILSLGGFFGLVVSGADGTIVEKLTIVNAGASLAALAVENADHIQIRNNAFSGFSFSVVLEQADHAKVTGNSMTGNGGGHGVTVINGDYVNVSGNDIAGMLFGVWACDRKGKCVGNRVESSLVGIILCKVPAGSFPLGTGGGGSEYPGNNWQVTNNTSNGNLYGYLVIDGANHNTLSNNRGANNLVTDMELTAETNNLFGFFTPTSSNNTVNVGGSDMEIIDCGVNNTVHGGTALSGPCSD